MELQLCRNSERSFMKGNKLYDLSSIIAMADAEVIAESLGLEVRNKGKTKSILCPLHNDTHFGSCQLFEDGYHCYVCNVTHDTISLVKDVLHCNARTAAEYILDVYGYTKSNFSSKRIIKNKPILSDKQLELIGLERNSNVYRVVGISEEKSDFQDYEGKSGYKVEFEPYFFSSNDGDFHSLNVKKEIDASPDGVYVLKKVIIKNPLQELANSDDVAYKDLIYHKAKEAKEKYELMLSNFYKTKIEHSEFDLESIKMYVQWFMLHRIAKDTSVVEVAGVLTQKIRECENLIIEFSSEKKKEKSNKSLFGKAIKNSVSL